MHAPDLALIAALTGVTHSAAIAITALTSLAARTPHRRRDARATLRLLLFVRRP
ncbi:hypothetical protein [Streptomyces sp. NPDC048419]|uniref:hypothetical protein n=1 Tax=Streptomyces sp. NPDC048419 TaxID=3365547 RepID=UPI003710A1BA